MSADRYVVLGLAHVRSTWFTEVARWSTSGSVPVEFVKCVSTEELRARMRSGRPFSAALLDGRLPAVDRDLMAGLQDSGVVPLVVEAGPGGPDWVALGARATLALPLERAALLDALTEHARLIGAVDQHIAQPGDLPLPPAWLGRLVAVTGRSGAGTSTIAAALAQTLADDPRNGGDVVLADLARHAHQALLHDARDVVPGIQDLVEANRTGRPSADEVRRLSFDVPARGYRLLLGLRRPSDWITIRSRAFGAALEGLRSSARVVVADIDADLEGEAATGSLDIEDRNLLARTVVDRADVVVVVSTPTTTGLHNLILQLADLRANGVPGDRILVVVNRAPRGARTRAGLARAIANLSGAPTQPDPHVGPVFVTERRNVDHIHRDLARFPGGLADPPGTAVRAMFERLGPRPTATEPVAVAVGSLGTWHDYDSDEEATS
ncbi:MAG: hypothetical protein ABIP03_13970 [Aquihabitans sp.]